MSRGCHRTTVSLSFSSPLVFWLCPPSRTFFNRKLSLSSCMLLSSTSSVWSFTMTRSLLSVFPSLFIPLQVSLSASLYSPLPHVTLLYQTILISSSFSLPHTLSLHLSLCGRVVINPYFIAGEFLSHCRADSSPRSKTLLGPNPILPPSIFPSLPPSGPDYWDSGGVAGWGRRWREASHHYTLGEERREGRDGRDGWCTTCRHGGEGGGRGRGRTQEGKKARIRKRRSEEDKWGLIGVKSSRVIQRK